MSIIIYRYEDREWNFLKHTGAIFQSIFTSVFSIASVVSLCDGDRDTLMEWNHDKDHVHILFKAHLKTEISKFINAYKSASSRLVKKEFPEIRQKL